MCSVVISHLPVTVLKLASFLDVSTTAVSEFGIKKAS